MSLSACSLLKPEKQYIDREVYIYKEIPNALLKTCEHPILKGKTYRDLAYLVVDYKNELEKCNITIEQIEKWNQIQKESMTKKEGA